MLDIFFFIAVFATGMMFEIVIVFIRNRIHTWLRLKSTSNNYPTRLNYHKKVLGHLWEGLSKNVFVKNLFGCLLIDQNGSKK